MINNAICPQKIIYQFPTCFKAVISGSNCSQVFFWMRFALISFQLSNYFLCALI